MLEWVFGQGMLIMKLGNRVKVLCVGYKDIGQGSWIDKYVWNLEWKEWDFIDKVRFIDD